MFHMGTHVNLEVDVGLEKTIKFISLLTIMHTIFRNYDKLLSGSFVFLNLFHHYFQVQKGRCLHWTTDNQRKTLLDLTNMNLNMDNFFIRLLAKKHK